MRKLPWAPRLSLRTHVGVLERFVLAASCLLAAATSSRGDAVSGRAEELERREQHTAALSLRTTDIDNKAGMFRGFEGQASPWSLVDEVSGTVADHDSQEPLVVDGSARESFLGHRLATTAFGFTSIRNPASHETESLITEEHSLDVSREEERGSQETAVSPPMPIHVAMLGFLSNKDYPAESQSTPIPQPALAGLDQRDDYISFSTLLSEATSATDAQTSSQPKGERGRFLGVQTASPTGSLIADAPTSFPTGWVPSEIFTTSSPTAFDSNDPTSAPTESPTSSPIAVHTGDPTEGKIRDVETPTLTPTGVPTDSSGGETNGGSLAPTLSVPTRETYGATPGQTSVPFASPSRRPTEGPIAGNPGGVFSSTPSPGESIRSDTGEESIGPSPTAVSEIRSIVTPTKSPTWETRGVWFSAAPTSGPPATNRAEEWGTQTPTPALEAIPTVVPTSSPTEWGIGQLVPSVMPSSRFVTNPSFRPNVPRTGVPTSSPSDVGDDGAFSSAPTTSMYPTGDNMGDGITPNASADRVEALTVLPTSSPTEGTRNSMFSSEPTVALATPEGPSSKTTASPTTGPAAFLSLHPTSSPTAGASGGVFSSAPLPGESIRTSSSEGTKTPCPRVVPEAMPTVTPTSSPTWETRGGWFSATPTSGPSATGRAEEWGTQSPAPELEVTPSVGPTSSPMEWGIGQLVPSVMPSSHFVTSSSSAPNISRTGAPTSSPSELESGGAFSSAPTTSMYPTGDSLGEGTTPSPPADRVETPTVLPTSSPTERTWGEMFSSEPTGASGTAEDSSARTTASPTNVPAAFLSLHPTSSPTDGTPGGVFSSTPSPGETTRPSSSQGTKTPSPRVVPEAMSTVTPTSSPMWETLGGWFSAAPTSRPSATDRAVQWSTQSPTPALEASPTAAPTSGPMEWAIGQLVSTVMPSSRFFTSPSYTPSMSRTGEPTSSPSELGGGGAFSSSPTTSVYPTGDSMGDDTTPSPSADRVEMATVLPTSSPMETPRGGMFSSEPTTASASADDPSARITASPTNSPAAFLSLHPTSSPTVETRVFSSAPSPGESTRTSSSQRTITPSPRVAPETMSTVTPTSSPTWEMRGGWFSAAPTSGSPATGQAEQWHTQSPTPELEATPTAVPTNSPMEWGIGQLVPTVRPSSRFVTSLSPTPNMSRTRAPTSSPSEVGGGGAFSVAPTTSVYPTGDSMGDGTTPSPSTDWVETPTVLPTSSPTEASRGGMFSSEPTAASAKAEDSVTRVPASPTNGPAASATLNPTSSPTMGIPGGVFSSAPTLTLNTQGPPGSVTLPKPTAMPSTFATNELPSTSYTPSPASTANIELSVAPSATPSEGLDQERGQISSLTPTAAPSPGNTQVGRTTAPPAEGVANTSTTISPVDGSPGDSASSFAPTYSPSGTSYVTPTAPFSATPLTVYPVISEERALPSTSPYEERDGLSAAPSETPAISPSPVVPDIADTLLTFSPTGGHRGAETMRPTPSSSLESPSPTASGPEDTVAPSPSGPTPSTAVPTLSVGNVGPTFSPTNDGSPEQFTTPATSLEPWTEGVSGIPTATPHLSSTAPQPIAADGEWVSEGFQQTAMPSTADPASSNREIGILTPTPTASSIGTPPPIVFLTAGPTDGTLPYDDETDAPSPSPTFGLSSDRGIGDDNGVATAAPSSPGEGVWRWWSQSGGVGDDRAYALARGVGEHADDLYIIGTEEDTEYQTSDNGSEARRQQRRMQSDAGSGPDVAISSFSMSGTKNWGQISGSGGDDVALCVAAAEDSVAIAGYTTGALYIDENVGEDDAFLVLVDPASGSVLEGWQFGGDSSERVNALGVDGNSGDVIIGGYTNGSLLASNDEPVSQFILARLDRLELLPSTGLLDLSDGSNAVVWGWQNATASAEHETIVSVLVDSASGVVIALGARGLPPGSSPQDADYVLSRAGLSTFVVSLDLKNGSVHWTSDDLGGLGMAVAVDGISGNVYVAGFAVSEDDSGDTVFVYKIDGDSGATIWTYQSSSEGVSKGRAFAIDVIGADAIVVGGTTTGSDTSSTDMFTLFLRAADGSERCYYQTGTGATDVITGVFAAEGDDPLYPDVTVVGYTDGSLAGTNAGGTDIFAIGLNMTNICSVWKEDEESNVDVVEEESTASVDGDMTVVRGTFAAGAASIMAAVALVGAAVSAGVASSGGIASAVSSATVVGGGTEGGGAVASTLAMAQGGQTTAATGAGAFFKMASAGVAGTLFSPDGENPPPPGDATTRSPAASLGVLVMSQLQFLAILSLVDSVRDSSSLLSSFVENLRWVNLWLPMPSSLVPGSCDIDAVTDVDSDDGNVDGSVFIGNLVLVAGLLLFILCAHVVVISAVEAKWLAQDRATAAITTARDVHGLSVADLGTIIDSRSHGREMRHTLAAIDAASSTGESLQMDEHRQRQTSGDRIGASLGRDNWDYSSMRQSPSISPPPASRVGTPSCSRSRSPVRGIIRYFSDRRPPPATSPRSYLIKSPTNTGVDTINDSCIKDTLYPRVQAWLPAASNDSSMRISDSGQTLPRSPTPCSRRDPLCSTSVSTLRSASPISQQWGSTTLSSVRGGACTSPTVFDEDVGRPGSLIGSDWFADQYADSFSLQGESGRERAQEMTREYEDDASAFQLDHGGEEKEAETRRSVEKSVTTLNQGHDSDNQPDNNPILACRRRSRSIWLHFPHLELLFLFWAFEGAVAAQVSAMRTAECQWVFWLALMALLLYPVLMIFMACRTIALRVRPNELLVFRLSDNGISQHSHHHDETKGNDNEDLTQAENGRGAPPEPESDGTAWAQRGDAQEILEEPERRCVWEKFASWWDEKGLLFAWADKGNWESVATNDQETRREADWFRIGFEPLFVDLSKSGCSYLIFLLFKWATLACVGVLVDDSKSQLMCMFALHAVDLAVLLKESPFANSAVNVINESLTIVDCASAGLLAAAATLGKGSEASTLDDIVFFLQVVALCALVIPVYIDAGVSLTILVVHKLRTRPRTDEAAAELDVEREEERAYVRRFARRSWPRFWPAMIRHNILACVQDVWEGVRLPRVVRRRNHTRQSRTCCARRFNPGRSAAPTAPVPWSLPERYTTGLGYPRRKDSWFSGEDEDLQMRGWKLPQKLLTAGQGAGTWGAEISRRSLCSTATTGKDDDDLRRGTSKGFQRGFRGSGSGFSGTQTTLGSTYDGGHGSFYRLARGEGQGRGGGGASGRSLIPSMFSATPVASNLPRKKSFTRAGFLQEVATEDGEGSNETKKSEGSWGG